MKSTKVGVLHLFTVCCHKSKHTKARKVIDHVHKGINVASFYDFLFGFLNCISPVWHFFILFLCVLRD